MECKLYGCAVTEDEKGVVIETLWNVNADEYHIRHKEHGVVIETLWNVNNSRTSAFSISVTSCNRDIVECKFLCVHAVLNLVVVVIETLWNVNVTLRED